MDSTITLTVSDSNLEQIVRKIESNFSVGVKVPLMLLEVLLQKEIYKNCSNLIDGLLDTYEIHEEEEESAADIIIKDVLRKHPKEHDIVEYYDKDESEISDIKQDMKTVLELMERINKRIDNLEGVKGLDLLEVNEIVPLSKSRAKP
jgi:polyhydroxyalkanoate synthesis regulator phasin